MFVFALVAGFREGAPNSARLQAAMDAFPVQAPDGCRVAAAPNAAAAVSRWAVVRRDEGAAPSWDASSGVLFSGDVRLYNRAELISDLGQLGLPLGEASDLELARLAYQKWGQEAPAHLVGDFAFAAWDERRRTLFAARDHFGMRPLYYRLLPDGAAVASDVRQLLALVDRSDEELNDERILDRLTRRTRDVRRTYFRGITRLAPGHGLVVERGSTHETRYWRPPPPVDPPRPYAENCERLLAAFRRAVRDRLESDRPIVAHSSGGFDSSTIIMAADEIYRREPHRPALTMASGLVRGFPCDESHYMDAVAARVSFEGLRWDVVGSDPLPFPGVYRAAPVLRRGPAGGPPRDLEIARERGARVLISGVLGDGVLYAAGVRRDMIRHGRWLRALRDILGAGLNRGTPRRIVDAGLGMLSPPAALLAAHRIFGRLPAAPEWMGPALRAIYPPRPERLDFPVQRWPSHVVCGVWAHATSASAAAVVDGFVDYATEEGVELRAPYADVRLVEEVLAIPWDQREPRGHHRRTGRDALGPLLPPEFSKRIAQESWTRVWVANALRAVASVGEFILCGPWLSAPFVDRGIARAMLGDVTARGETAAPESCFLILEFGALEAWLRCLFR